MAHSYTDICERAQQTHEDFTWDPNTCAWFFRTRDPNGLLSNMASRMPIDILDEHGNTHRFASSEHLYQCGRFPHRPDLQALIANARSPMASKFAVQPHLAETRLDWQVINVRWMLWVLRMKLASNWDTFGCALRDTDDRSIVERSSRDPFWGAILRSDGLLHGRNVLGSLLTWLRAWRTEHTIDEARAGVCPVPMRVHGFALQR